MGAGPLSNAARPGGAIVLVVDDEAVALALAPDLKVLFMSGFSTEVVVVHGLSAGDPLLVKPFSLDTLGRKVHEILDYRSPFSRPPQPPR